MRIERHVRLALSPATEGSESVASIRALVRFMRDAYNVPGKLPPSISVFCPLMYRLANCRGMRTAHRTLPACRLRAAATLNVRAGHWLYLGQRDRWGDGAAARSTAVARPLNSVEPVMILGCAGELPAALGLGT